MSNTSKYSYNSKKEVIEAAKCFIEEKCAFPKSSNKIFNDPSIVGDYLILNHEQTNYETFSALFLNSKNKLIKFETLFSGSINSAQVYPRTVAQKALTYNAAAIIFVHHHPSGDTKPSQSDINLTIQLKKSLALIDVKVLDHFVLGGKSYSSLAALQLF